MIDRMLIKSLQAYKRIVSPLLGQRCRFYPSCSNYAMSAIERHGTVRGTLLATSRLLRCQPLCEGGLDPVPEQFTRRFWARNASTDPPADAPDR
ncbi:MAG: membrane protein insertion efficiency factor YidD [Xanthomonadales bacterium]|nr:membrane protein insertion efficiency factor YidD [Xanthomonadales bacterium]